MRIDLLIDRTSQKARSEKTEPQVSSESQDNCQVSETPTLTVSKVFVSAIASDSFNMSVSLNVVKSPIGTTMDKMKKAFISRPLNLFNS